MNDLQAAVGPLMALLLEGGPDAAKALFRGKVVKGADTASNSWRDIFAEEPECYAVAHQIAQNPQDTAARDRLQRMLAVLLKQMPALVQQIQPEKQTIVTGDIAARVGGVAIGVAQNGSQIIVYNLAVSQETISKLAAQADLPKERSENATRQYLGFIEQYHRYLPLKGMGDNSGLRLRFPLVELFIPLNARLTLPKDDTLSAELRIAGRTLAQEEREHIGGRPDASRPVLDLLTKYPVLVILGDPGSGKSTVVRLLAYLLATGQGEALELADYLPLLLPLATYAEKLEALPDLTLRRFALEHFRENIDVDDLDAMLEARLNAGKVLVLLDGLDEVKEVTRRNTVIDRVQRFLSRHIDETHIDEGNRVIMTSRIIGYKEVRPPEVAGLRECTLLDFEDVEIKAFIQRWTHTIEQKAYEDGQVARYEAAREARELLASIDNSAAVRKLASNPLLLTMLVIQKRQGVRLPRERVLLYEQYIVSLLRDWLLARSPGSSQDLPNDRALRKVLEPLAYWMQESEPGLGLVNETDLWTWLRHHFTDASDPEETARQFIKDVRESTGLLVDRGGNRFGFLHLTFMEYLAGVALANRFQEKDGQAVVVDQVVSHADKGEWRETLLLAIGYLGLKQGFDAAVTDILHRLLERPAESMGLHHELVASALADMGEDGVTPEGWHDLREQLVTGGLRNEKISATRRVSIGSHLADAGDPRKHVMELDAMPFCYVPPGPFFLGSTEADDMANEKEKQGAGEHRLDYGYWLSRFPVTVAQFRQYADESAIELGYTDCLNGPANTPVVWVSWEEAMAFCGWLTQRWMAKDGLPAGCQLSLPSEAEWEKAARGGTHIPAVDGPVVVAVSEIGQRHASLVSVGPPLEKNPMPQRRYPWGDAPDAERMNYEMNIGNVSVVGAYRGGASPYGCEEMSGNVWEWTRNLYKAYPYPDTAAGRKEREGEVTWSLALRGGAFSNAQGLVRCAARSDYRPFYRYANIGFRVVLSPFL